jgi:hypothetical protein
VTEFAISGTLECTGLFHEKTSRHLPTPGGIIRRLCQ